MIRVSWTGDTDSGVLSPAMGKKRKVDTRAAAAKVVEELEVKMSPPVGKRKRESGNVTPRLNHYQDSDCESGKSSDFPSHHAFRLAPVASNFTHFFEKLLSKLNFKSSVWKYLLSSLE